jgi:hypothetical protein
LFSVEGNKVVPISIEPIDRLPVYNPKYTYRSLTVYSGLEVTSSPRTGKKYLIARKWRSPYTAPIGSLVYFSYESGSFKHTYYSLDFWAVVDEGEYEIEVKPKGSKNPVRIKLKNLRPIAKLTDEEFSNAEAEILNKGWEPGRYNPVRTLYYYWIMRKVHEKPGEEGEGVEEAVETGGEEQEPSPTAVEVKVPEVKPKELEVVLEGAPAQAVGTATTAVGAPSREGLVRVYLLNMRLPSKYLVQKVVKEGRSREIRSWEGVASEIASKLEGIRRACYDKLSRVFAFVEDFGVWVAVTEEGVEEARKVSEWVRSELSKLPIATIKSGVDVNKLYTVRAVPVYLEPGDAEELLKAAIRRMSQDVAELEARISEARQAENKKTLRRLESDLEHRKRLLETFKKHLDALGLSKGEEQPSPTAVGTQPSTPATEETQPSSAVTPTAVETKEEQPSPPPQSPHPATEAATEVEGTKFIARYSKPGKREYIITHYANDEGTLVELVTDERFRDLTRTEKPSSSETYIYLTPQALKALEGRVIMQERWVGDRLIERKYYTVKDGNVVELSHERKKDLRGFYDEVSVDGKTYKVYRDEWKVVEATNKPQIVVEKVGDKWWVSGQTYQLKDELKKRGGKWGGTAWIFENEPELADIAEVIRK